MPDTPTQSPVSPASPASPAPPPPVRRSVWTTKEKLIRLAWSTLARPFWHLIPACRPALIRCFGGRIGKNCALARSIEITIPWHLTLGDHVRIGPRCILYGLGMITIGDNTILDARTHLCAGTHDMTDSRFPLQKTPITIGADSFLGIDTYIGPGVTLGHHCTTWPRTSVYKSFPDHTTLAGNPAKPVVDSSAGSESNTESHTEHTE